MMGFKQTEIGLIPEDWEVVRLGEIFEIQQGKQLSRKKKVKGENIECKFLRTSNVFWEGIKLDNLDTMLVSSRELNKLKVKKGDIFVCEGGDVGRTAILEEDINFNLIYQNHLHRLRPKFEEILPKFFVYWMEKHIRLDKAHIPANVTTIPNLSASRLKFFKIPLPPLEEQKQIAKVLDKIQQAIELQDKIIEQAKNLKKSLMQKLFTEGLYGEERKETEIGLIPESWGVVRLGDIGVFQYGYTESALEQDTGIKFLRITDIVENGYIEWSYVPYCKIDHKDFEKYQLKDGDVLFARIGATTGKTCFIYNPPKSVFASYLIRFKPKVNYIETRFVHYYTQTAIYWRKVEANKEGKLKKGLSASVLKNFLIPLPPLPEQQQIAHILSIVDRKIEVEKRRKTTLKELFKTMLRKLMSGEIRLKEVEI